MDLNSFDQEKLSLEDFAIDPDVTGISLGSKSASHISAVENFLNGVDLEQFKTTRDNLRLSSGRDELQEGASQREGIYRQQVMDSLPDDLINPEFESEYKSSIVNWVRNSASLVGETPLDQVAREAAIKSDDTDLSEEQFEMKIDWVDAIEEVNAIKYANQAKVNEVLLSEDQSVADNIVDIAELFVPIVENVFVNDLYKHFIGGNTLLMGNQKEELFRYFQSLPPEELAKATQSIINIVDQNDQILLPDGNVLAKVDVLNRMLVDNDYGSVERWFDNWMPVAEIVGALPAAFKALGKVGKAGKLKAAQKAAQAVSDAEKEAIVSRVAPNSVSETVSGYNPSVEEASHLILMSDETGEAAKAIYGTDTADALAHNLLPNPQTSNGSKVKPNAAIDDMFYDGNTYLTDPEYAATRLAQVRKFHNVDGMQLRSNSLVLTDNVDGSLRIEAMYSPKQGFANPTRAMESAKFAFRGWGLTEENLTLYRITNGRLVETTQAEINARRAIVLGIKNNKNAAKNPLPANMIDTGYAVGIKYDYYITAPDVPFWEKFTTGTFLGVPLNIFDGLPGVAAKWRQGSVTQNIFDAASVLHRRITEPAGLGFDKSVDVKKAMIEAFQPFTDGYKNLPASRRAAMTDYINEANEQGIAFNVANLRNKGFNTEEIGILRNWKEANDVSFAIANRDMAKSMNQKGYKVFVDDTSNTKLFVKPVKRGAVSTATEYYNPRTGNIEKMGGKPQDVDDFYTRGGTFAKLSEPIQVGNDWVEYVRVENTMPNGYLRAMKVNEPVMKYREGYYPRMYDANFFVTRTVTLKDGTKIEKAVGAAATKDEAKELVEQFRASNTDPNIEIDFRPDFRSNMEKNDPFSEATWSLMSNSGLSNQRTRGEALSDITSGANNAGKRHLVDPLEAVSAQIEQLSAKVPMRNYFEAVKTRWIKTFAEPLGLEKNKFGEYEFPSSISDVKGKGTTELSIVRDARSMYNYISGLESGYINGIDAAWQGFMNYGAAEIFSKLGIKSLEKASLALGKTSPTNAGRSLAFRYLLAANPVRQLPLQSSQIATIIPNNPTYMLKGGLIQDTIRLQMVMLGNKNDLEAVKMWDELVKSGLRDAVDVNNLVRKEGMQLADLSVASKLNTASKKPIDYLQKIGFDTAERAVLVSAWLSEYNKLSKTKDFSKFTRRDWETIAERARSFTWSMNRGGDQPYNRNTFSIAAQFLQASHKALLQSVTNKTLSPKERATLFTWTTVMWGGGVYGVDKIIESFVPEGELRDTMQDGLAELMLNESLSALSGEKQQLAWSDFAPTNIHTMGDLITNIWTLDPGTLLAQTPAGSMIFGTNNPRVMDFLKSTARWTNLIDDYQDPELDTKYTDVANAALHMMSGWSNAMKSRYAFKVGQKVNSLGNVTDAEVTKLEAVMASIGIRTQEEKEAFEIRQELYKGETFKQDDVRNWYNELKRTLARKGMSVREKDMAQRILTESLRVFEDEPVKFRAQIVSLIQNDINRGDYKIFEDLMDQGGWRTPEELRRLFDKLPPSEMKDTIMEFMELGGEL